MKRADTRRRALVLTLWIAAVCWLVCGQSVASQGAATHDTLQLIEKKNVGKEWVIERVVFGCIHDGTPLEAQLAIEFTGVFYDSGNGRQILFNAQHTIAVMNFKPCVAVAEVYLVTAHDGRLLLDADVKTKIGRLAGPRVSSQIEFVAVKSLVGNELVIRTGWPHNDYYLHDVKVRIEPSGELKLISVKAIRGPRPLYLRG